MAPVESYGREYAPEVGAYPVPRINRIGAAPAAGAAPGPYPQTRVFPFTILATAGNRSSVSSPKLLGPSIIRAIVVAKGGTPKGTQGFVLGKATSAVSESNVPTTTGQPYTVLFEGLPSGGGAAGAPNQADGAVDMQSTLIEPETRLDIVVPDQPWFLVVSITAAAAGGDTFQGHVIVLDQVSPAALVNFL